MPETKDGRQEELLQREEVSEAWKEYQRDIEVQARYFNDAEAYELQRPEVDGRVKPNPNDLSSLFLERAFHIAGDTSYVAQVLPGVVFSGASCKDLRGYLLDNTQLSVLATFENHGIFRQIDSRYKFGIVVFENSGSTEKVAGITQRGNVGILEKFNQKAITIPSEVLELYSPEAQTFPYIESEKTLDALRTMIKSPSLGNEDAPAGYMEPYQGLRRTNDSDRFVDEAEGEYPVFGGKNIH
jgi:hypothetical protein